MGAAIATVILVLLFVVISVRSRRSHLSYRANPRRSHSQTGPPDLTNFAAPAEPNSPEPANQPDTPTNHPGEQP